MLMMMLKTLCNLVAYNLINYKVLHNFNIDSIDLESSQFLQTDITPESKCSNAYCFSLVFFLFPIIFARVFLRNM